MSHHKHRSRSSSCSSDSRYKKKRGRKHSHRRSRSRSSSRSSATSVSSKNSKKSDNQNTAWENIVLHYLSKLKNYWSSVYSSKPASKRNSQADCIAVDDVNQLDLTGGGVPPFEQENYCQVGKRKALNIVSNALEYGLANGIVSQNGNYFWIKDKLVPKDKISNPRMPPSKCGSCHCKPSSVIIQKKSSTCSPAKVVVSKKSVKAKVGKPRGIRKKRDVLPTGKPRKKRVQGCTGFLNKCKCSKCKSIFKLL